MQLVIKNPIAMRRLGGTIAGICEPGCIIYLQGELGAGKTTLVRGFLRKLGYLGHVRSPTFNLFEIYQAKQQVVCHFDLYRLNDPKELVYIGAADYFDKKNICLVEWPDQGQVFLPAADLICNFTFTPDSRGRIVRTVATTEQGLKLERELQG